jgi:hypothetical protein
VAQEENMVFVEKSTTLTTEFDEEAILAANRVNNHEINVDEGFREILRKVGNAPVPVRGRVTELFLDSLEVEYQIWLDEKEEENGIIRTRTRKILDEELNELKKQK